MTAQVLRLGLGLASTAVLARLLAPDDFGLAAMATAVVGFVLLFREMGLSTATVQSSDVSHAQVSTLFWINVAIGWALAGLLVALAYPISLFFGAPELTGMVLVLSLGAPLGALAVQHRALLQRQMKFGMLAIIDTSSLVAGIGVAIVLALEGARYWALVVSPVVTQLASAAASWIACRWRPSLPQRGAGVRPMLGFGANLVGFNIVNYLGRNLDNVLIGRFLGAGPLGLYSRAYSLLLLPLRQVNAPLAAVAVPAFSRLADVPERYRRGYCDLVEKMLMITMPFIAFLIICADWVILVVLGPQWVGAARIYAYLGIAGIVQPLVSAVGWLFITQGRTREMFRWGLIGCGISITSFLVGLPWGAVGVAAGYGLSGLLLRTPLLLWYVSRHGPVTQGDLYRTLRLPSFAVGGVACALLGLRELTSMEAPTLSLAIALAVAVAMSLTTYGIHPDGRRSLVDFARLLSGSREPQ